MSENIFVNENDVNVVSEIFDDELYYFVSELLCEDEINEDVMKNIDLLIRNYVSKRLELSRKYEEENSK